eukprot:6185784-Pleurochrysis_carterae.AAC.3
MREGAADAYAYANAEANADADSDVVRGADVDAPTSAPSTAGGCHAVNHELECIRLRQQIDEQRNTISNLEAKIADLEEGAFRGLRARDHAFREAETMSSRVQQQLLQMRRRRVRDQPELAAKQRERQKQGVTVKNAKRARRAEQQGGVIGV